MGSSPTAGSETEGGSRKRASYIKITKNGIMQRIKPKWLNSGLVLVCERCYKERIPDEDPDKAAEIGDFNLRDWLKKKLKEDGHWGKVRAVSTSCQDVCARRQVTVVIDKQTGTKATECFVIDPITDRDAFYQTIVDRLGEGRSDESTTASPRFEHYEDDADAAL